MSMDKIVEMIPDNLPDWVLDAMERGQLFKALLDKIEYYEDLERKREIESLKRDSKRCHDAGTAILQQLLCI